MPSAKPEVAGIQVGEGHPENPVQFEGSQIGMGEGERVYTVNLCGSVIIC